MPRDSSGVYTLPESPFVPTEVISSGEVNSNFNDIGNALTQSVATNGVSRLTGPIKAFAGTANLPSYTFVNNVSAGIYLSSIASIGFVAAGALVFNINTSGMSLGATKTMTVPSLTINNVPNQGFARDVVSLFVQTAAPLGWTKSSLDDSILRIVNATASIGGTLSFSEVFATLSIAGSIANTVLTVNQIPSHNGFMAADVSAAVAAVSLTNSTQLMRSITGAGGNEDYGLTRRSTGTLQANATPSSFTGESAPHNHGFDSAPIDLNVEYVDVIAASKG